MKFRRNLSTFFVINYLVLSVISIITIIIFFTVMILDSKDYLDDQWSSDIAQKIIRPDYKHIEADSVIQRGGWVEIVHNNRIVYVIGDKQDHNKNYDMMYFEPYLPGTSSPDPDYEIGMKAFKGTDGKEYIGIVKVPNFMAGEIADKMKNSAIKGAVISLLFFFICNTLYIFYSKRKVAKPLILIQHGIDQMTKHDYSVRLNFKAYKEAMQIQKAFNFLVEKLESIEEEKKLMEEQKYRLLRDISHDIKTPMTSILGFSKALVEKDLDEEKKRTYLEYIHSKSTRLNGLVDELFYLTKLNTIDVPLRLQIQDMGMFLENLIISYYGEIDEKQFELDIILPESPVYAEFDTKEMSRAVGNLISNALKYNPRGTELRISLHKIGTDLRLVIQDNGIGIEEKFLSSIFHEFARGDQTRGSDGGSGLGLAITKRIVDIHKGHISIYSTLNKGTTFSIILPLYNDNKGSKQ
ncbi:sensor histidine kinase [Priestia koreensis]|uniref:sensor histidine kinase n=1 Tax=Priestia koreensis TaxID=284581 RepID=UPI00203DDF5F|nr:HAMP domain-containing sensor histidine kinase [Priestia koreensis]MCM3004605.1 HAMP domain-containing histidine kinase [Priestia koreensis]